MRVIEFRPTRLLIIRPFVVTWNGHTVSTAQPFLDGAVSTMTTVRIDDDGVTREVWQARGVAVRLWPVRTSRRVRQLFVGWEGGRTYGVRRRVHQSTVSAEDGCASSPMSVGGR